MILNKSKSGILEFKPRHQKTSLKFRSTPEATFEKIPIVSQYRYLRLSLTPSLQPHSQVNYIQNKAREIYTRINPFIQTAEADTRKNLWQVFILPQVEFLLLLFATENTKYWRKKISKVIMGTFKLFTRLSKNTPNKITEALLDYDFIQRSYLSQSNSRIKWEDRRMNTQETIKPLKPKRMATPCPSPISKSFIISTSAVVTTKNVIV